MNEAEIGSTMTLSEKLKLNKGNAAMDDDNIKPSPASPTYPLFLYAT